MQEREVILSDKTTVVIRELNSFESMIADGFAARFSPGGAVNEAVLTKAYALASIRKINGEDVTPLRSDLLFQSVAERLSLLEMPKLLEAFVEFLGPTEGPELKNGSEAAPSA